MIEEPRACRVCGLLKPATSFGSNGKHTARRAKCNACRKAEVRRREGAELRIAIAERVRQRREDEAVARDVRLAKRRQQKEVMGTTDRWSYGWVERLKRELPAIYRRHKNKAVKTIVWHARYQLDPTFKAAEIERARRKKAARLGYSLDGDGSLGPSAIRDLFALTKRCPICRRRMTSEMKSLDHIVPVSRGGTHSILNARVICKRCNAVKGAKMPQQATLGAA